MRKTLFLVGLLLAGTSLMSCSNDVAVEEIS